MGDFDQILKNCNVLDVRNGKFVRADIAIKGGTIAAVGKLEDKGTDCKGLYALPGFIDSHVHIESSQLCPARFAEAVVPFGTTVVIADPHEIANVCGMAGVNYMLEEASHTPLEVKMMMPSCVPASNAESSGAVLNADVVEEAMKRDDIFGLGEMMNYPGVLNGDEDVMAKILAAKKAGKPVDGHFPLGSGRDLAAYVAAGITSDHECCSAQEAAEKADAGMNIFIRQGSAAKQLVQLLPAVNEENVSSFSFCTDDYQAADIVSNGHINSMIALAVAQGMRPETAVRLATLNAAEHYDLKHLGALEEGKQADIVLVSNLVDFSPVKVYKKGVLVAENGRPLFNVSSLRNPAVRNTLHMPPVKKDDLALKGSSLKYAMRMHGDSLIKDLIPFNKNLPKLCVAERHKNTGRVRSCLLDGYGVKGGAIAISVSHDSHNVICAGDNDADMCLAINSLMPMGGGICVVHEGKVAKTLPLPIGGLMSDAPACEVAENMRDINEFCIKVMGIDKNTEPVMSLSFLALTVIPDVCLTDRGLFDVRKFCFI